MSIKCLYSSYSSFLKYWKKKKIVVRFLSKSEVRETSKAIQFCIPEVGVGAWQRGVLSFCHCMFTWCCWYVCNAVLDLTDPSHSSVNGLLELSLWADLFTLIGYWFCVLWFDYCIFDRSKKSVPFAHINAVSGICASVSGSAMSRALTGGRQPCLRGRVTPRAACCPRAGPRCVYTWMVLYPYIHTHPIHHAHTRTGCCSGHHPFSHTAPDSHLTPNSGDIPNDLFAVWIKSLITGSFFFFFLFLFFSFSFF